MQLHCFMSVYMKYLRNSEHVILFLVYRFKVILGHLQIDNQLPLTLMPVLLAPDKAGDSHQPVLKMTITMCNEETDGTQVYPYVYVRVCILFRSIFMVLRRMRYYLKHMMDLLFD